MKFQNIFTIYAITLSCSIISLIGEPICENAEGKLVPCQKIVDKLEDIKPAANKKKRDEYSDWLDDWYWNPWNWWYNNKISSGRSSSNSNTNISSSGNSDYAVNNAIPRKTTKTVPPSLKRKTTKRTSRRTVNRRVTTRRNPNAANKRRTTTRRGTPTRGSSRSAATNNLTNTTSSSSRSILNKKPFTMNGFIRCSSDMKKKIEKTINDIITYRAAGLYVAKDTTDVHARDIFKKYFKSESERSRVVRTLQNVNNMSSATAYCEDNTDSACREQAIAWTYLNSKEFHVCPAFFTQIWHGTIEKHTSEAASVILHELTHCHGTDDYAYGDSGCRQLSANHAANNADSFRLFCMNAIYYLQDKSHGRVKFSNSTNIDFRVQPFHDKVVLRAVPKN